MHGRICSKHQFLYVDEEKLSIFKHQSGEFSGTNVNSTTTGTVGNDKIQSASGNDIIIGGAGEANNIPQLVNESNFADVAAAGFAALGWNTSRSLKSTKHNGNKEMKSAIRIKLPDQQRICSANHNFFAALPGQDREPSIRS